MKKINKNGSFYHPIFWLFTYIFIHFIVRIFLSQTLQVDDAEQIDYAQNILLGYPIPPPVSGYLSAQ
jgi:hypothetical protein